MMRCGSLSIHISELIAAFMMRLTRIGCIGCPLASTKQREKELARYPMFKKAYLKAFDRMLSYHKEGTHGSATWKDAEDVYELVAIWIPKRNTGYWTNRIIHRRELGNIVKEIEKETRAFKKSGKMFFKRNCMTGKRYQFGTEENLTTDGEVLNQIRELGASL